MPTGTEVALSCDTAGAEIRYTTGGGNPTMASAKYTAPIPITQDTVIKAKAYNAKGGYTPSEVLEAAYEVQA